MGSLWKNNSEMYKLEIQFWTMLHGRVEQLRVIMKIINTGDAQQI